VHALRSGAARPRRRSTGGAASTDIGAVLSTHVDVGAVLSTHVDVGAVLSTHVDVGSRAPTGTHEHPRCRHLHARAALRQLLGPALQLRCVSDLGPPLDVGLEMGDSIGSGTIGQRSLGG
jgi:hypothetical protein